MNWDSPSAFFAMGGYAVYVWGSFAVCAIALAGELLALRSRRAAITRAMRQRASTCPIGAMEQPA